MIVKNLNGALRPPCACGHWLAHWINHTGVNSPTCAAVACTRPAMTGALAQSFRGVDSHWYVTPLCLDCLRARTGLLLSIRDTLPLVIAEATGDCIALRKQA